MKTVFIINEDWIYRCEGGVNTRIFSTYQKAKEAYDAIIKEEKEEGIVFSSIENEDCEFDTDEDDSKSYALEEANYPDATHNTKQILHDWQWYEKGCYCETHVSVQLFKQNIEE